MPMILAQMPIYSKKIGQKKILLKLHCSPILGSGLYMIETDRLQVGVLATSEILTIGQRA